VINHISSKNAFLSSISISIISDSSLAQIGTTFVLASVTHIIFLSSSFGISIISSDTLQA
jgi:hypothetical protein